VDDYHTAHLAYEIAQVFTTFAWGSYSFPHDLRWPQGFTPPDRISVVTTSEQEKEIKTQASQILLGNLERELIPSDTVEV
jgi:hypothetical protein